METADAEVSPQDRAGCIVKDLGCSGARDSPREDIGYIPTAVLQIGRLMAGRFYTQWRDGISEGPSRCLFVGQLNASLVIWNITTTVAADVNCTGDE